MKYAGAAVGGALLAGCTGVRDPSDDGNGSGGEGSYSVTMEPVGTVSFETAPASWVGGFGFTADVLTALGRADGVAGMAGPSFWFQGFYDALGVETPDPSEIPKISSEDWTIDLETLYETDPDVFTVDPNVLLSYGVSETELDRLIDGVAPFLGNASRRKRAEGWPNWPDGEPYGYYDIPTMVRLYGKAFDASDRATALVEIYERALTGITDRVPTGTDRPTVGVLNGRYTPENRSGFVVYNPASEIEKTYGKKQYRDLDVRDAFAGIYDGRSSVTVDYETLLEYDPDVIIFHLGVVHRDLGGANLVRPTIDLLADHPVARKVTAVEDDALYVGGTPYQGPISNLFQSEMTAKQLYPDIFGEWPGFTDGEPYPEIPEDERLFDRQRLVDIVEGGV
ncbi:hypothetical protein C479_06407 [Halovivax asiaticus JCM 14624]|uniref:Fe/B12 periplasmic-binding domain-containing protein n=1 Tax=Halovivax asiaticus JCM 14624 TaxID=1227490 RepID=M0BLD1_9EURY|nr:hypothetical protein C479_06407 [Halovivax asiaticus JCM 14624]